MTSMDLGSLLSDLVAAKKRMREKCMPKFLLHLEQKTSL